MLGMGWDEDAPGFGIRGARQLLGEKGEGVLGSRAARGVKSGAVTGAAPRVGPGGGVEAAVQPRGCSAAAALCFAFSLQTDGFCCFFGFFFFPAKSKGRSWGHRGSRCSPGGGGGLGGMLEQRRFFFFIF